MMARCFFPFLYALPGVLAGALVMHAQGIAPAVYVQNIVFLAVGGVLSIVYMTKRGRASFKGLCAIAALSVLLLYATFLQAGTEGVHRWVQVGPLRLNAAFISLPVLLIAIDRLLFSGYEQAAWMLAAVTAAALFLQPDASMLSAFSLALIPFFYTQSDKKLFKAGGLAVLLVLSGLSWMNAGQLEPVPHVEGILALAWESGWLYAACCVVSLPVMAGPFFRKGRRREERALSVSLGLFFTALILSALSGEFPVPLVGYGASPIVGYLIAAAYVEKRREHPALEESKERRA